MGRQGTRAVALFLTITYPIAVFAQASGAVASLVRDVLSISRGQAAPHPLSSGEPIVEGQEIQTAQTGAVNVNFPNGTAIAALRQADITFGGAPAVAGQGLAQPMQGLDLVTLSPGVFRVSVGLQPTTVRTRRGGAFILQGQGGPGTALIEEQADGSVTVSTLSGAVQVTTGGSSVVVPAGSSVTLFGAAGAAALSTAALQPISASSQAIASQFAAEIGPVTTASAAPAAGGAAGAAAGDMAVSPLVVGGIVAAAVVGAAIAASEGSSHSNNPSNGSTSTSTSTSTAVAQ